jgi:hypothetical protein
MKALKQENLEELISKVYDLINKTKIEIGHNTDGKTLAQLSRSFAQDLIIEKRFGSMTFNQIEDAFRLGVRFSKDEPFLNIRTFYKWVNTHKEVINYAENQVREFKMPKDKVPYYQEPLKQIR